MDAFDRLVVVNRHNAPEPLELFAPLELAIDKAWCQTTSRSIMGIRKWQIFEATSTLADQLPAKTGLYMFVWRIPFSFPTAKLAEHFFRTIVYIGQAGAHETGNSLQQRYKQEYSAIVSCDPEALWKTSPVDRASRLRRFLNLPNLEFWYHEVPQTDLLGAYEELLIKLFNPPANSQFVQKQSAKPLRARLGRAIPAF